APARVPRGRSRAPHRGGRRPGGTGSSANRPAPADTPPRVLVSAARGPAPRGASAPDTADTAAGSAAGRPPPPPPSARLPARTRGARALAPVAPSRPGRSRRASARPAAAPAQTAHPAPVQSSRTGLGCPSVPPAGATGVVPPAPAGGYHLGRSRREPPRRLAPHNRVADPLPRRQLDARWPRVVASAENHITKPVD